MTKSASFLLSTLPVHFGYSFGAMVAAAAVGTWGQLRGAGIGDGSLLSFLYSVAVDSESNVEMPGNSLAYRSLGHFIEYSQCKYGVSFSLIQAQSKRATFYLLPTSQGRGLLRSTALRSETQPVESVRFPGSCLSLTSRL